MVRDTDGCFIVMNIETMNKRIALANVYGPIAGDIPSFFEKQQQPKKKKKKKNVGNDYTIILG